MYKIIKYKLINIFEDKKFNIIIFAYIALFNFNVLINSGLLTTGSPEYSASLKYSLVLNNYIITSITFGLIVSVYLGAKIIGRDIELKQLYVLLTNINSRVKYIFCSWISVIISIILVQISIFINFLVIISVLGIKFNVSEIINASNDIILNMIVIVSITALFSVILEGYSGAIIGLLSIIVFNIHSYLVIPLINMNIILSDSVRRVLVSLVPIKDIKIASIIEAGFMNNYSTLNPYLISNIRLYQTIFSVCILLLMIKIFSKKDL